MTISFASFDFLPFISSGLKDSINPCALIVTILFLALLLFTCSVRIEIFLFGGAFITTLLVTSLFLRLGIFESFCDMDIFFLIGKSIYYLIAVVTILLGAISLYDWRIYRRTHDPQRFILKIPSIVSKSVSNEIQEDLRQKTKERMLVRFRMGGIAIVSGVFMAIFEAVCLPQDYLPALFDMLILQGRHKYAFYGMIFYNIAFILPLVFILICVWIMTGFDKIIKIAGKNVSQIKIIYSALFLGLGFGLFCAF